MGTESVIDTFPSVIYDLYRARGKGDRKKARDPYELELARTFVATYIKEREKELKTASGKAPTSATPSDERMLGNRVLGHEDLKSQYSAMQPEDWVGVPSAAFYHGRSRKNFVDHLKKNEKSKPDKPDEKEPWQVDLSRQNLMRRR